MKKIILVLAAAAFTLNVSAQHDSGAVNAPNRPVNQKQDGDPVTVPPSGTSTIPNTDKTNNTIGQEKKTPVSDPVNTNAGETHNRQAGVHAKYDDGVVMQNGKVMMVKAGRMEPLTGSMTMSNGYKVMSDGTIVKKDGSRIKLREGEHMDMTGNKISKSDEAAPGMKNTNRKDMYLVPDSAVKKVD